jgi:hypothetical protein
MDFVDFAFRIFGRNVEALYYSYFLLLAISTLLFCIQFWRNYFALFAILAFQFAIFSFLDLIESTGAESQSNPRFLSLLALTPFFHAVFLIMYQMRPSRFRVLLFAPQGIVMAAAAEFRSLAYGAVIALTICCLLLLAYDGWRRKRAVRMALWRYWPAGIVLLCIGASVSLQAQTADRHLAEIGGMRAHTFWEPLYYDLQLHPDWTEKYGAQHKGATGDDTTTVAVESYRERHDLMHNKADYVHGDEAQGLTQVAYEKYTRDAYIEFVLHDPWYVAQLKYYNALTIINFVEATIVKAWGALNWWLLMLGGCTIFALSAQLRARPDCVVTMTSCTGVLILASILIAVPVWITVVNADLLTDLTIFAVSTSFVAALCVIVTALVLLGGLMPKVLKLRHAS